MNERRACASRSLHATCHMASRENYLDIGSYVFACRTYAWVFICMYEGRLDKWGTECVYVCMYACNIFKHESKRYEKTD